MRMPRSSLATSLLILTGCGSYGPPADLSGVTRDQLVARMGQPATQRQIDGGTTTRLEYSRGPYGLQTWFVDLDAAGHVIRSEQVLTEKNFNQINPAMDLDEVLQRLGRPGVVQALGRSRGHVWSYRYLGPFCQWFQVEISLEQKVRSAGYGEPPECDRPNEIIVPRG